MTEVADPPQTQTSGYSHDVVIDRGDGFSDEPFIRLQADELPPPGVQAIDNTWALVVRGGQAVAFLSPEIVTSLDPGQPVTVVFDGLEDAYVADFGQPRDYFRANLGRPLEVSGRIVVFSRDVADAVATRAVLTDLATARCPRGRILPPGKMCSRTCDCSRRH